MSDYVPRDPLVHDLSIILRGVLDPGTQINPGARLAASRMRDVLGIPDGALVKDVEWRLREALAGEAQPAGAGRPVIVRAVQTCGAPVMWDAWDEDGSHWALRFRFGRGDAQRGNAGPGPGAGLSFEHEGGTWVDNISLEEFCERAGLELRLEAGQ